MDIGNSINILENSLRDLIESLLRRTQGDDWYGKLGVSEDRLASWKSRMEEEAKRRPGASPDDRLLYYSELFDVIEIIRKNWDKGFHKCFGDRKRFDVYMDRIGAFRNPDAHSRALMPFEEHLVEGMTGELRQRITIFLSEGTGGPEREYFPRIEEVIDNFGNRANKDYVQTDLTLRVGDRLQFTGRAWDPDGDIPTWDVTVMHVITVTKFTGLEFEWSLTLEPMHVGERFAITFTLVSPKPYHKNGFTDGKVQFTYKVMPPFRSA